MAGGILFVIMLVIALILVGFGTFLLSKARTIVQDADFWRDGISNIISSLSAGIEDFFQLEEGTVHQWITDRIAGLESCLSTSQDGLLSGSLRYLTEEMYDTSFWHQSSFCVRRCFL